MKIVKFENKQDSEAIKAVIEMLETSTNFIFMYSDDKLSTVHHIDMNLSNVEKVGCLDCVKHKILHDILPDGDDGDQEYFTEDKNL